MQQPWNSGTMNSFTHYNNILYGILISSITIKMGHLLPDFRNFDNAYLGKFDITLFIASLLAVLAFQEIFQVKSRTKRASGKFVVSGSKTSFSICFSKLRL